LASLINQVNEERAVNIVTVESPVEFLHKHKKSIVRQREVGSDTHSFAAALQHLLRHDPDVVLISELESRESISAALKAAETGHLVFSAMHTRTVPATIHRLASIYPDSLQKYVRLQLADCLKAVISQQLVPRADGGGRVAAVEVLINTAAVSEMIREGQDSQLYTAMKTGRSFGMQTMDKALSDLCLQGAISREEALKRAANRSELERLLRS
jgi:twitching motility protein PilT